MSEDRFILLDAGASRPTRVSLPPGTTVKAGVDDAEGRFTLVEYRGHDGLPDDISDTFVYVLDGELGVDFDGETHRLTEGMCAFLPSGVTHAMRSLSDTPVHALHLSSPGTWGRDPEDAEALHALSAEDGKSRFYLLGKGDVRPGRLRVPPAFASKVRSTDTDDRLSLLEMVVAQQIPRHVHHLADESIYVLDGELVVEFVDRTYRATPGQFVLLPHGVPHALRPGSGRPPRVLQISSPGGWECFIEDLIEARRHITTGGELDARSLNPIAAKYGITYEERP
ncbi:cupin domain-containing protein [Actinoallomurus sp. NPDC050550]|uniref:cupin domain-containing protein n=1 Tax=Actinoallomurus sp. NPDC050550 TaxID=3154937 RepID=UPI00340ADEFA